MLTHDTREGSLHLWVPTHSHIARDLTGCRARDVSMSCAQGELTCLAPNEATESIQQGLSYTATYRELTALGLWCCNTDMQRVFHS